MMTLGKYLADTGMKQVEFARRAGISTSHVCDIVAGRKEPKVSIALRIVNASGGAVGIETMQVQRETVS